MGSVPARHANGARLIGLEFQGSYPLAGCLRLWRSGEVSDDLVIERRGTLAIHILQVLGVPEQGGGSLLGFALSLFGLTLSLFGLTLRPSNFTPNLKL